MAKQNSIDISKYVLVTEENRSFCICKGRVCYVFSFFDKKWSDDGEILIRPRIKKEGWFYFGQYKAYMKHEESVDEFRDAFKPVIDLLIKEKKLYINPKKHLVKFEKP